MPGWEVDLYPCCPNIRGEFAIWNFGCRANTLRAIREKARQVFRGPGPQREPNSTYATTAALAADVRELEGKDAERCGESFLLLATLSMLALVGVFSEAQTYSDTSEIVYGTFHIETWGQTGKQLFSSSRARIAPIGRRKRWLCGKSPWVKTRRAGRPAAWRVHVVDFNHALIYTQEMLNPGPVDKIVTWTQYTHKTDRPDTDGTLQVVQIDPGWQGLPLSRAFQRAGVRRRVFHTITKHFRDPHHKPEDTFFASYDMPDVHLHLKLDWSQANWTIPYTGSIVTFNRNGAYRFPTTDASKADPSKTGASKAFTYWLHVKATWQLKPR